ncbi:MAG: hypothetical protein ACYDDU_09525 [Dermatophilaceae bacterium]
MPGAALGGVRHVVIQSFDDQELAVVVAGSPRISPPCVSTTVP